MSLELEKKEIEKTIQQFFDGFDNFDAELVIKAFINKNAEVFSVRETGKGMRYAARQFREMFENAKNEPDNIWNKEKSKKNIVYIDVTGCAAQAKVEYIFSAYKYTDYYNLLKVEGQWYITNKTFDTEFFTE